MVYTCALCKEKRESSQSRYQLRAPEGGSGKHFHVCAECIAMEKAAKMVKSAKEVVPGLALGVKSDVIKEEVQEMAQAEEKKKRGRPRKTETEEEETLEE